MRLYKTLAAIGGVALLAITGQANAQTNFFFQPTTGDWYSDASWLEPNLETQAVPSSTFNEIAIIEDDRTANVDSNGGIMPGRIVLGNTLGQSGTLNVNSGGVLTSDMLTTSFGTSPGSINVGTNGVGILNVLPGGSLSSDGPIISANNAANTITVGDATGTGTATLSPNSASLSGTTRVYSNSNFTSATTLAFGGNSSYNVEVNSSGNGFVRATGTATLGGALNLNFNSGAPSLNDSWVVAQADSFAGGFSSINSSEPIAFGQSLVLSTAAGGGQTQATVSLEEVFVLEVNRDTGVATVTQPGSTSLELDGYYVGSDNIGALDPSGWTPFAGQSQGDNWIPTANDANTIGEFKATGSTTIGGGGSVGLGAIYDPFVGAFGDVAEDLEFVYTRPSDGAVINGIVNYSGTAVNSLLLQVDPSTGETFLRNTSSTTVQVDGYDVQSASSSLSTTGWDSLDDQNQDGDGTWLELLNVDGGLLGELNASSTDPFVTLTPGASLNLGNAYVGDTTGSRDLSFQFFMIGEENPTQGVVVYEPFTAVEVLFGDADNDLAVAGSDLLAVTNNFGATGPADGLLLGDADDDGAVAGSDLLAVTNNFGSTLGSGNLQAAAVPEPASVCLTSLAMAAMASCFARRRRSV